LKQHRVNEFLLSLLGKKDMIDWLIVDYWLVDDISVNIY
jgi:hypothetical protein